mgnify:CR=1 FL=1
MSMKRLERVFSLLIAVLMVTTAFIPAVSAAEPNRAASNANTAPDSFSGTTTFTAGTSPTASGAASNGYAKAEKDLPLFSEDNWSRPTSWTNASSIDAEEPGMDASPATGTTRVVTGSGKTKLKVYDRETRTIRIKDAGRSAAAGGDDEVEIRLVNATPDLGTFTEIFEVTAHRTIALDGSEDFLATWALHSGNENITRAEWFVWEEQTQSVEIPIIEYREVTLENVTPEGTFSGSIALENITPEDAILEEVAPDGTTPVDIALENVSPEGVTLEVVVQEGAAPEYATPDSVSPEDATFETVTVREPYIAGTETVEQSWPEWVPFAPDGQMLNAGETRLFKVIYTKPAELGQVDINTAPVFRGVACPEMTWWSTAWAYRVPVAVTNPPSIDGYPHREVVAFRSGMQSDFDDVRFVTNDGIVLDYWKETCTPVNSAVVWVNLPAGTTSIWMYYGSGTATDIGSRDNAYILYDDFNGPSLDTTLWMDTTPGAHYFSNGWIYDTQSRGAGVLVSNDYVITNGEPVIAEMYIHVNNIPLSRTFCGYFPLFVDTPSNGVLWYPGDDRYIVVGSDMFWRSGQQRGLFTGLDYFNTCIVTPSGLTHSVTQTMNNKSFSYTDVFSRGDGLSNHRMYILGGDNSVPGRSIRMDWIWVRKYVQTEPAFTYGTPQSGPIVTITSPHDDTVPAGANVTVAGFVADTTITSLTLTHNNVSSTIPVQGGNFSTEVTLADANTITVGGTDSLGNPFSTTLLLDGDMLPAAYEQAIGFDPLNADSDCSQWPGDQAGNGVIDGYEIFAGDLPVFAKYRIDADPFVTDTDGDGLTDSFELLKLGTFPEEPGMLSMMGEGGPIVAAGTDDDPDGDGLSNLEEQTHGTDPLSADTDKDGLSDSDEILRGTDPCAADTDGDGLIDSAEVALGTNPTNPDSNGNGVPDGAEDYWSGDYFLDDTLHLEVFGRGYAVANVSVAAVNYTHLISEEILVSKVAAIGFGNDVESGTIAIAYDPTYVENASRLAVYRFDEDLGTFVNVSSTVDAVNGVVSCAAAGSAKYAVMDSMKWDALFANPLGVSSMMETAEPLGEYSKPQVLMPPETLVEGVDYGVVFYDELPAWYLEALEAEALEEASGTVVEGEGVSSPDGVLLEAGIDGYYQVVANGNFSNGQQAWAPSGPYYDGLPAFDRAEVDTYTYDYTSSPRSLKINVWARDKMLVACTVAHANIDLTDVDTLTFQYKCIESEDGGSLGSSGLRFWVDGYGDASLPNFRDPGINSQNPRVTPNWQTATVDVSGMDGQRTIYFQVFVSLTSTHSGISSATYLIDDVTAWSSEPPADPNRVNVRLFVRDSLTYVGVPYAKVLCNGEEKYTDSRGYTYDFFVRNPGVYSYFVEGDDYHDHYGLFRISQDDFGTGCTKQIFINRESMDTGSLYVSSTPNNAEIYIDGTYCGRTNGIIEDILAEPDHNQHIVEVRKEGYATASRTVTVNANQQTNVPFDLTAQTGTIAVTSSPPGAAVYLDSAYQGTTSAASGQLTLPGIPVGAHRLDILKDGYGPYTTTVTVVKDQTAPVTATLTNDDRDGDGLPDGFENGYRDGFGRWHAPDPYLIDTDGDGLSDGYEAGEMVVDANGKTYFKQRSDPNKVDTDYDGLDDYWEDSWGTDPYESDTDHDGSLDGEDDEPLIPANPIGDYIVERIRENIAGRLGLVFGETGLKDEACHSLVGDWASHPAYFVGWVCSGILVYGDARDLVYSVSQFDTWGAALNGLAFVPLVGDAEKVGTDAVRFIGKYPEKIRPLGKYLAEQGIIAWFGESGRLTIINEFFPVRADGVKVGTYLTTEHGLHVDDLVKMMGCNVDLSKVLRGVKRADGKIAWLDEGDDTMGWIHIAKKHITGELPGDTGTLFPSSMTETGVKNLIFETFENPIMSETSRGNILYYHEMVPPNGQYIRVVTNLDGRILSAYMVKKLPTV